MTIRMIAATVNTSIETIGSNGYASSKHLTGVILKKPIVYRATNIIISISPANTTETRLNRILAHWWDS